MPRYDWPADSFSPIAPLKREPRPVDTAPVVASLDVPGTSPVQHIRDEFYTAANDSVWHWFVVRDASALHPIVTIQGWDGPHHVSLNREWEGATPAKVKAWIETTVAQLAADAAKKRAKGGR